MGCGGCLFSIVTQWIPWLFKHLWLGFLQLLKGIRFIIITPFRLHWLAGTIFWLAVIIALTIIMLIILL